MVATRHGTRGVRALKVAASVIVLMALACISVPTWSSFSSQTANAGNTFSAGTVVLTDDDAGTAMFSLGGLAPGAGSQRCIRVTYAGSLPSTVRLHASSSGTGLADHLQVVVRRGTIGAGTFGSCTGFAADSTNYAGHGAGVVWSDVLSAFPGSWADATDDPSTSERDVWATGETHAYQFEVTLLDHQAAQGLTAGATLTWEARNATYDAIVQGDAPSSWWRLDETSGTTAADSAGPNQGTYAGGPTLGRPSGVRDGNTAVGFDGSNDRVTAGDVDDFAGLAPMSVEAWVNRTTFSETSFRRIVSKDWNVDASNRGGWALKVEGTSNQFGFTRYANVPTATVVSTTTAQPGTWYHVVVTFDGSLLCLYVDGVLEASTSTSVALIDHAFPLTVGQQADGGSRFQGDLDEVAIWDRALSAGEVSAHYDAGR